MRIAIIGRTKMLLDAANIIKEMGHEIVLVVTSKESSFYEAKSKDFEAFANSVGAHFISTTKANAYVETVKDLKIDVGISMNCTSILNEEFLNSFKFGVFNAHPGDLPKYKGNACPNWAILNGEERIALTVHQMNTLLDDGPIAEKKFFLLEQNKDVEDFYYWMSTTVPEMFSNLVLRIANNTQKLTPQSKGSNSGLRCFPRQSSDSLIDWTNSAEEIDKLVKASTRPFEGAYTFWGNHIFRIWKSEVFSMDEAFLAIPGQLMFLHNSFPVIATSNGAIKLNEFSGPSEEISKLFLNNLRNRFQNFSTP